MISNKTSGNTWLILTFPDLRPGVSVTKITFTSSKAKIVTILIQKLLRELVSQIYNQEARLVNGRS